GGKDFEQVVVVPRSKAAFHGKTELAGRLTLEQHERTARDEREVLGTVGITNGASVLVECDVEAVVKLILNAPVAANAGGDLFGIGSDIGNVVKDLATGLAVQDTGTLDSNRGIEVAPGRLHPWRKRAQPDRT